MQARPCGRSCSRGGVRFNHPPPLRPAPAPRPEHRRLSMAPGETPPPPKAVAAAGSASPLQSNRVGGATLTLMRTRRPLRQFWSRWPMASAAPQTTLPHACTSCYHRTGEPLAKISPQQHHLLRSRRRTDTCDQRTGQIIATRRRVPYHASAADCPAQRQGSRDRCERPPPYESQNAIRPVRAAA